MAVIYAESRSTPSLFQGDGQDQKLQSGRIGQLFTEAEVSRLVKAGYGYCANAGKGSSPITFAGVYDADAPDMYFYVPSSVVLIPLSIEVIFEAVGTESTMEIIALASSTADSSATVTGGAAVTPVNLRLDKTGAGNCTVSYGVDAAGITDPNAGRYFEFWKYQRPLTDTVATTENDRLPLVFRWRAFVDGPPPFIYTSSDASLSIYAASQAGTGFITVTYLEVPPTWIVT